MPDLGSCLLPHNTRQKWNLINCVYLNVFVYFGSATQKLYHIFRLFRLRFQLFENFLAAYFLVWAVARPGPLTATMTAGFNLFVTITVTTVKILGILRYSYIKISSPSRLLAFIPPPLHTLCLIMLIYAEFNLLNHYLRYQRSLKG